jgi:Uma2 family endonuclease
MKRVLLDSSAILASLDVTDRSHRLATDWWWSASRPRWPTPVVRSEPPTQFDSFGAHRYCGAAMAQNPKPQSGPFLVTDLKPGDRHELSRGNAIYCVPTGGSGSRGTGYGFAIIDSDPAVESAGVDAGFTPSANTLRAPDVSVGVPDQPGWIPGVPPLALEYAGTGQDENTLQGKIADLLEAGTQWVWVVRLTGPRRVEIYAPGKEPVVKTVGDLLTAPGILQNPVRAEALWDRQAAHEGTLLNLLQRAGYVSLEAVREEGREEGLRRSLLSVLEARGFSIADRVHEQVRAAVDAAQLERWLRTAVTAKSLDDVFAS